jgi:hypothetical protein
MRRSAAGARRSALSPGGRLFFTLLRDRQDAHSQRASHRDVTVWGSTYRWEPAARPTARALLRLAERCGQQPLDVATNPRETRWREAEWGDSLTAALWPLSHALEGRLDAHPLDSRLPRPAPLGLAPADRPAALPSRLVFLHDGAAAKRVE